MLWYEALVVLWTYFLWTKVQCSVNVSAETTTLPSKAETDLFNQEPKETDDVTVRRFFPIKGKQKWIRREYPHADEMLFFNVSTIPDNEEVRLAQLHLHRRKLTKTHGNYHKKLLPSPYRVVLYQVQPNFRRKIVADAKTMKLASLPVSHVTSGGWHTLDATAVLRELLINAQGPIELLLGVQFEAPKGIGVPLKHFLKSPGSSDSTTPYKTPSYLVVFSEMDPYFDYFDDYNDSSATMSNALPTAPSRVFKERHLKHKILKDNENNLPNDISKFLNLNTTHKKKTNPKEKSPKHKKLENGVYKREEDGRRQDLRHKNKHKRSKADELALQKKNKLKSLPFLHANEVEEIRQTSRRLTRSLSDNGTILSEDRDISSKDIEAALVRLLEAAWATRDINDPVSGDCGPRQVQVDLERGLPVSVVDPPVLRTMLCSGQCADPEAPINQRRACRPRSRSDLTLVHEDKNRKVIATTFPDFIVKDCECR